MRPIRIRINSIKTGKRQKNKTTFRKGSPNNNVPINKNNKNFNLYTSPKIPAKKENITFLLLL